MTREEEIKAHLDYYNVKASMDIKYLLTQNEELQHKVDALQRYWDAVKWLEEVQSCYTELQLWLLLASDEFILNFFNEYHKIEQAAKNEVKLARAFLDAADVEEK